MSSTLQEAVTDIVLNDYLTLVVIVAVGYDYILTFSKEVEYIWNKPRTWVSMLYVLARYCGLCCVVSGSICNAIVRISEWSFWIFMLSADLVMILRVWTIHDRSKLVLSTLLIFYVVELVSFLTLYAIFDHRLDSAWDTIQVLQFSLCVPTNAPYSAWITALDVTQIVLGSLMCFLTAIRFFKELLQMYRATRSFQLNRYMRLLVRDGMIYFAAILLFALTSILADASVIPNYGWGALSALAQQIPAFTLVPRFILSLRELYARDVQGSDIDTAFGLGSRSAAIASDIMFADAGQNEGEEAQCDEIVTEERMQEVQGMSNSA